MTTNNNSSKELRELIGLLVDQGFHVNKLANGRFRVTRANEFVTVLSPTSKRPSSHRNARAALRRAGFTPR